MKSILEEIKKTSYSLKWGEKYSTLIVDMFAHVAISYPDIISNDISEYITYVLKRKIVKAYYSDQAIREIEQKHGIYFLKKERINKLLKNYDKLIGQYSRFFQKFHHIEFYRLTNNKLYQLFKEYVVFTEKAFAIFRMTRAEGEIGPSEKIKKILEKYYHKDKVDEIFKILSESTKNDLIGQERESWLGILRKKWDEGKIKRYLWQFAANFANIYDLDQIMRYLKTRYKHDRPRIFLIHKEIMEAKNRRRQLRLRQKNIYARCKNNKDLIIYTKMLQDFGPYRFKLKYAWAGAELHLLGFFQEISRRINVSLRDFFDLYLVNDVLAFFRSGKVLNKKELTLRAKCILVRIKKTKYESYFGYDALKIVESINKSGEKGTEYLKGMVAFQGYTNGRVRVVHSNNIKTLGKMARLFKKGDILVSEGTQPAMIVLMKKAGAILTEVGGMTSHAAIISREFRKPCIVGIKGLLNILNDGDRVEVDADTGVVKKL